MTKKNSIHTSNVHLTFFWQMDLIADDSASVPSELSHLLSKLLPVEWCSSYMRMKYFHRLSSALSKRINKVSWKSRSSDVETSLDATTLLQFHQLPFDSYLFLFHAIYFLVHFCSFFILIHWVFLPADRLDGETGTKATLTARTMCSAMSRW